MDKVVIVGRGFVAGKFLDAFRTLLDQGASIAKISPIDITNEFQIRQMIVEEIPSIIINCAGKTGRPNIDWCEHPQNRHATWASNVLGPILLAKQCLEHEVFLVHIGSGCIYEGDNGGMGFSEEDLPTFTGSFYSRTKIEAERALDFLHKNAGLKALQLRLRMPLDCVPSDRNLITKITNYHQVISEPNSISVMDDFLPAAMALIHGRATGIYNVVNPGSITHKELLEAYTRIVDPTHTYELISLKDLEKKTLARRSNCVLDTAKLQQELKRTGVRMREVHDAVEDSLRTYRVQFEKMKFHQ